MKKPTPPRTDGEIYKALMDAFEGHGRRQLIEGGTPEHEADRIIGQGLKAVMGNPRPEPWKFYCERCRDTGWSEVRPSPETEQKLIAMYGSVEQAQPYYVKCEPCKWTQLEREKRRKQAGQEFGEEDEFVTAGQVKPKRKFSQFGR